MAYSSANRTGDAMTAPTQKQERKPMPVNGTGPKDRTAAGRTFGGTSFCGVGEPLLGEGLWLPPKNGTKPNDRGPDVSKKQDGEKEKPRDGFAMEDVLLDTSMMHVGP